MVPPLPSLLFTLFLVWTWCISRCVSVLDGRALYFKFLPGSRRPLNRSADRNDDAVAAGTPLARHWPNTCLLFGLHVRRRTGSRRRAGGTDGGSGCGCAHLSSVRPAGELRGDTVDRAGETRDSRVPMNECLWSRAEPSSMRGECRHCYRNWFARTRLSDAHR